MIFDTIIIGAGLSGLECARTLLALNKNSFLILEKNSNAGKLQSWKTFPSIISNFNLGNYVTNESGKIIYRTIDIESKKVCFSGSVKADCQFLDSEKIYVSYKKLLNSNLELSREVVSVEQSSDKLISVKTRDGECFQTKFLVDASGVEGVSYRLPNKTHFEQNVFYSCYAKRFKNCDTSNEGSHAYFDFDSPFELCGAWYYPVSKDTIDIGIARLTTEKELNNPLKLAELDHLLDQYMQFDPFKSVLKNASYHATISGYTPLLPRTRIQEGRIYYIGDNKGNVPFSGYGVENALESGRAVALSISSSKKYNYFITKPSFGLSILYNIMKSSPEELKTLISGISRLNEESRLRLFTGKINFHLMLKLSYIAKIHHIDFVSKIPKGLILKAFLHSLPSPRNYHF